MASSVWSLDPGYGKIRDICAGLGYSSDVRVADRYRHDLRDKTARHRKKFVSNSIGLSEFPLDYTAPEVKACASSFLDNHHYLFNETQSALEFGWPVYPRDAERILIGLAKLMCTQKWYAMKNCLAAELKRVLSPGLLPLSADRPDQNQSEQEQASDAEPVDTALMSSDPDIWNVSSSPPAQVRRSPEVTHSGNDGDPESDIEDQDVIRENIVVHLNYIYPLGHIQDGKGTDWLFKSYPPEPCPTEVKPYIFRYLHDHQLYSTQKINVEPLQRFVKDLKRHLQIICTPEEDKQIYNKCKNLVNHHPTQWAKYGFLRRYPFLRRTQEFEKAWKDRRTLWLASRNIVEVPDERDVDSSVAHSGEKRLLPQFPSQSREYNIDLVEEGPHEEGPHAKRQKLSMASQLDGEPNNLDSNSMNRKELDAEVTGESGSTSQWAFDDFLNTSPDPAIMIPRRAPVATMVSLTANQSTTSPLSQLISQPNSPTAVESSSTANPAVNANSPDPLTPVLASEKASAPLRRDHTSTDSSDGLNQSLLVEKRSTPYGFLGHEVEEPEYTVPTPSALPCLAVPSTGLPSLIKEPNYMLPPSLRCAIVPASSAQTPRSKPRLEFILEKRRGILDWDAPVSREEWWNYNLPEIFALVGGKSGQLPAAISCLTLRYNWGSRGAMLVGNHFTEQDWEKVKKRIKNEFFNSREEMPNETEFQISVKSGDTTGQKGNKEDEGW